MNKLIPEFNKRVNELYDGDHTCIAVSAEGEFTTKESIWKLFEENLIQLRKVLLMNYKIGTFVIHTFDNRQKAYLILAKEHQI